MEIQEFIINWINEVASKFEGISLFNERKTKLANGKEVREGDKLYFIDSDRQRHEGLIQRRQFDCKHSDTGELLKKGTLFFWNNTFRPLDYYTADVVT